MDIYKPVLYISVNKDGGKFNRNKFYESNFGTSNTNEIVNTLSENYGIESKDCATLVIDNIDYCTDEKGKVDPGLLTFLNGQLYQGLKMCIILLSSINNIAYEIKKGNSFINIILHY